MLRHTRSLSTNTAPPMDESRPVPHLVLGGVDGPIVVRDPQVTDTTVPVHAPPRLVTPTLARTAVAVPPLVLPTPRLALLELVVRRAAGVRLFRSVLGPCMTSVATVAWMCGLQRWVCDLWDWTCGLQGWVFNKAGSVICATGCVVCTGEPAVVWCTVMLTVAMRGFCIGAGAVPGPWV